MQFKDFLTSELLNLVADSLDTVNTAVIATRLDSLKMPKINTFKVLDKVGVSGYSSNFINQVRLHSSLYKINYGTILCELNNEFKTRFCLHTTYSTEYGECVILFTRQRGDVFKIIREFNRSRLNSLKITQCPILDKTLLDEIIQNSITFVKVAKRKKLSINRGILLYGTPGCGKSMMAAYLKELCDHHNLSFQIIKTAALARGEDLDYFSDINVIDDIDITLLNRKSGGVAASSLLSALDGVNKDGKARSLVFTTNEKIDDIEKAFIRPGRIDMIRELKPPTRELRQRLILERWPDTLRKKVEAENTLEILLDKTKGFSFAELAGVGNTYLVYEFDNKNLSSLEALDAYYNSRDELCVTNKASLGFGG